MRGRRLLLIPVVWLGTVAGASAATWSVISAAGAQVGQPSTAVSATANGGATSGASRGVGTWTGRGGRMTAACSGISISLKTAVPEVGYWVKVYNPGPESLRVDFESTDPDDRSEVRIGAVCTDGGPVFHRL